jgi:5-methylcytosine-specific restriction endonuclease McrA
MRHEFSKATKREARARSGGLCEAVGSVYGLEPGRRCNAPLSHGVEFDHYPAPATDPGSDTLENCVAVCKVCHRFKTSHYDVPMQAKNKRQSDRHLGITTPKRPWGYRPMRQPFRDNTKYLDENDGNSE